MKRLSILFVMVGAMLIFTGSAWAQQVKFDYDRDVNFSQFKTYSWGKVQTKDELFVDRIKDAVNSAMAAKGLTMVESGGDICIIAIQMTQNQQTLNTFYDGFGGGWGWRRFGGGGFGTATTTTETYKVGTLVLDLYNSKTKELIWRGSSSNTLSNNSNKNISNLNKGVEKLFKNYPPNEKK